MKQVKSISMAQSETVGPLDIMRALPTERQFFAFDDVGDGITITNPTDQPVDVMIFGGEPYSQGKERKENAYKNCLLYTSDAADE